MEKWLSELKIDERSSVTVKVPQEAKGMGLTDAPRGALGHWISIKGGRSPTTRPWSPRPGIQAPEMITGIWAPWSRP